MRPQTSKKEGDRKYFPEHFLYTQFFPHINLFCLWKLPSTCKRILWEAEMVSVWSKICAPFVTMLEFISIDFFFQPPILFDPEKNTHRHSLLMRFNQVASSYIFSNWRRIFLRVIFNEHSFSFLLFYIFSPASFLIFRNFQHWIRFRFSPSFHFGPWKVSSPSSYRFLFRSKKKLF